MNLVSSTSLKTATKRERLALSKGMVFIDFDNTITTIDVLDDILERFSIDDHWRTLEEKWQAGKMSTKECLEGQLRSVRITRKDMEQYLSTISIDPFFQRLLGFLRQRKVPVVIVSDNFSFMVTRILRNHRISGVRVYSNGIRLHKDQLIPSFPYQDASCPRCAHCKRRHLLKHGDKTLVYIGDGLSDVCAAEEADWVFAKGRLLDDLRRNRKPCIPFENLGGVYRYLLEREEDGRLENA